MRFFVAGEDDDMMIKMLYYNATLFVILLHYNATLFVNLLYLNTTRINVI